MAMLGRTSAGELLGSKPKLPAWTYGRAGPKNAGHSLRFPKPNGVSLRDARDEVSKNGEARDQLEAPLAPLPRQVIRLDLHQPQHVDRDEQVEPDRRVGGDHHL